MQLLDLIAMVSRRAIAIAVVAAGICGTQNGCAKEHYLSHNLHASAHSTLPNPSAPGPYRVESAAYDLGDQAFKVRGFPKPIELAGMVHYPVNPAGKRFPLVVFLHGHTSSCWRKSEIRPGWPCAKGYRPIPNHRGFDYIGERLAEHGFVVVSIRANGANQGDQDNALGMTVRGLLVQKHLEMWRQWATLGGQPFGARFKNAIDFSRVGTVGHSRGGEGVLNQYRINTAQGKPFGVRAIFLIAPTNHHRPVVAGVPLAILLPECDGDLSDQPGVHYYDDARYLMPGDASAKHILEIKGANHNFFNTVWSPGSPNGVDDGANPGSAPNDPCQPANAARLTAEQQQRVGLAYVVGFFRFYLGNDRSLAPMWRNEAPPFPSMGHAKVLHSYLAPDEPRRRRDINRFLTARDLHTNFLGGKTTLIGFSSAELCGEHPSHPCLSHDRPDTYEPHRWEGGLGLSILRMAWSRPEAVFANEIPVRWANISGYRALVFRAAMDFTDPLNPPGRAQDLRVTLVDGAGNKDSVAVSSYSAALTYPSPSGHGATNFLLRQVRIPLTTFRGVDLRDIRSVLLDYSVTERGAIGLTDLAFSE